MAQKAPAGESSMRQQAAAKINEIMAGKTTWGEALGVNAGQAYNMAQLGYKLLQEGKLEDAQTMFQGLVTLNPKDPYMHLALGAVHHRAGRVDEAIASYSKAIELNPKLTNAYANRGELFIVKKDQQKAINDLKKAVELDPKGQDPSTIRARAILATAAAKLKEKGVPVKAGAKKK